MACPPLLRRLSHRRLFLLVSLLASIYLVSCGVGWLRRGARNLEEDIRQKWGPLQKMDLYKDVVIDAPLTQEEIVRLEQKEGRKHDWNAIIYYLLRWETSNVDEMVVSVTALHEYFNQRPNARYPVMFFIERFESQSDPAKARALKTRLLKTIGQLGSADGDTQQCAKAYSCRSEQEIHAYLGATRNATRAPLPWDSHLCSIDEETERLTKESRNGGLNDFCLPWPVIFAEIEFGFPPTMTPDERAFYTDPANLDMGECGPTRVQYRHMCRHMTYVSYHPLLDGFDYYWRLDDDGQLRSPLPYDPFKLLHHRGASFAWTIVDDELPDCRIGFLSYLDSYRSRLLSTPGGSQLLIGSDFLRGLDEGGLFPYFYNNFELGRFDFWRQTHVRQFLQAIDDNRGTYLHRWGDAPIRTAAVSLFLEKEKVLYLNQIHYQHEIHINYPQDSIEKRLWQWLWSRPMGLPLEIAFQWWSYGLQVLLFAAIIASIRVEVHLRAVCRSVWCWLTGSSDSPSSSSASSSSCIDGDHVGLDLDPLVPTDDGMTPAANETDDASPLVSPSKSDGSIGGESTRIDAIDWINVIAICGIIFGHCIDTPGIELTSSGRLVYLMRDWHVFTVPALLFIAGFLCDKRTPKEVSDGQLIKGIATRMLVPYFIGTILYIAWIQIQAAATDETVTAYDRFVQLVACDVDPTHYYVFVCLYLSLLSVWLRRLSIHSIHLLFLSSLPMFLAHCYYLEWFPLQVTMWCQRSIFGNLLPFMFGYVSARYYQLKDDGDTHRPAYTLAHHHAQARILGCNVEQLQCMIGIRRVVDAVMRCRLTVTSICVFLMVTSLMTVQTSVRLHSPTRLIWLQTYIWCLVFVIATWSRSKLTILTPTIRAGIRWVSDSCYTIFLYHLFVLRPLQSAILERVDSAALSYVVPLWCATVAVTCIAARVAQAAMGPHAKNIIGSTTTTAASLSSTPQRTPLPTTAHHSGIDDTNTHDSLPTRAN